MMIHRELLEVLWYLKGYNGVPEPETEVHFKQLQKLRSIAESAFSSEAKKFIDDLLGKIQSLPTQKNAYKNEVTPEVAAILEGLGVDPNIHDFMGIQYMEVRNYFSRGAFEEFERLFPVKA